jgi:type IV secretory pathway TrbD component
MRFEERQLFWTGAMPNEVHVHPVYRALNKPLTIWGAERRLFFLALLMGAAAFNFFGSLLTGLLLFIVLYLVARWATVIDPQLLRIVLNAAKFRAHYDPAKREGFHVEVFGART